MRGLRAIDLSDPDSNAYVPYPSPLYGNQFVQVSQGDHQLVFSSDIGSPSAAYNASDLTVLNLQEKAGGTTTSAGVTTCAGSTATAGRSTSLTTAGDPEEMGRSTRSAARSFPGQVLAAVSETGEPNSTSVVSDGQTVDTLNLATGVLTPFATGFVKASGEVWVSAAGGDTAGPLGPAGPSGATGASGPRGPSGHSELVICVHVGRTTKCTTDVISGSLTVGDRSPAVRATISRNGHRYATGTASSERGPIRSRFEQDTR